MVGEDIKILACRVEDVIDLTIACAFISEHIHNINEYRDCKNAIGNEVLKISNEFTERTVNVSINPDDKIEKGSIYLTVIGTSIEHGDCGITGRGNRIGGVISPSRPMCIESVAGKPLMNHPGKLYSVLALKIAQAIVKEMPIEEAYVKLAGKVGHNINEPHIISIEIVSRNRVNRSRIASIASYWIEKIDEVRKEILDGAIRLF
jgi:S-adenosylmethionine synthetase